MTDSAIQVRMGGLPWKLGDQAPTDPPRDVERIDAAAALAKYQPPVVVGSWITQRWNESLGDVVGEAQSFAFGVDEVALINQVETYIHIGNLDSHGRKRALALPHRVYEFPWLWSRSYRPEHNRIWVWDRAR